MVAGLLKLVFILCTIAVVGLSVVDTLWFNAMPESNRYKNVQAFNVVTAVDRSYSTYYQTGNDVGS